MSWNATDVSVIVQLQWIAQDLSLTIGFILLISGTVGNILNIITVITTGHYKRHASSLYIIARSLCDLIVIGFGLGTRVFSYNFRLDPTKLSHFWCKFRLPLVYVSSLTSLTFLCFQSIDAFLSSSRSVVYRRLSSTRTARYLIIATVCIWTLHEVPYVYFQRLIDVVGTLTCEATNTSYAWYHNYLIINGLWTVLPIAVITVFGFLAYGHVRQRHALLHLSRQLTIMALAQLASVFVFQVPAGAAQTYFFATVNVNKDPYQTAREQVVQLVFSSYGYGTYASSFYCYYMVSHRFRRDLANVLRRLIFFRAANQVLPQQ